MLFADLSLAREWLPEHEQLQKSCGQLDMFANNALKRLVSLSFLAVAICRSNLAVFALSLRSPVLIY